jgi:hypothetical protein
MSRRFAFHIRPYIGYNNAMIAINEFRRNQSRFPREELEKYNGQFVAWSDDGTRILAAQPDRAQMEATLVAAGIYPDDVLISRIAVPEEIAWNGWWIEEMNLAMFLSCLSNSTAYNPHQFLPPLNPLKGWSAHVETTN